MSQVVQDEKRERLTRIVAAASLVASSIYIIWRWGWTLDRETLWFSLPLVVAETYGLVAAAFLTYTAWRLRLRRPLPVLEGRSVDVFVTTIDEPIATIRKTALAAREIRYPHTTWLLDDGGRDEVRTIAEEMGIRYLRRDDRTHGKAGNLNHALAQSSGEFMLQLDADHVPLPQIVDRLIGFFEDERLAYAQSPQDFYNTDAFTDDVHGRGRQLWGDQQLFFNVLQPGKDRHDAAMFVGSCAMLRRAAIEDVGGFATETAITGTETSLLLHAKGWRSAYLRENLAFGLAPATAHAYQEQQLHRAQGAMQALRRYQPLALPGLDLKQRIEYLHTLTSPLASAQRVVLYLAPIVFLTTGVFPIRASVGVFLAFWLPAAILRTISYRLLTRGQGSLLNAARYGMAKFFTHLIALRGYLTPHRLRYAIRLDESGAVPLRTVAPQLTLIGVTAVALGWASYARTLGYATEVPGWGAFALIGAVLLALWHAGLAAHIAQLSLAGRHRRGEFRFAESLSVGLRVLREDGKLASTDIAITEDLTATGLALRCMYPIPDGARVELTLPLSSGEVRVRGHVVRHSTSQTQLGPVQRIGVEFDATSRETRDAIELHCAQHAMPIEQQRQGALRDAASRRLRDLRGEQRVDVGMPARVITGSGDAAEELGIGLLEDVSPRGGRVLLDYPIEEGTELTLQIPGSTVRASGRVVFVHALETALGMRFVAGFETPAVAGSAEAARPAPWHASMLNLLRRTGRLALAARGTAGSQAAPTRVASGSAGAETSVGTTPPSAPPAPALARAAKVVAASTALASRRVREALAVRTARDSAAELATSDQLVDDSIERVELAPLPEGRRWTPISTAVIPPEVRAPAAATPANAPASDPERVVEMEIDGDFSFPMELTVGATFLITESGRVAADISTVHAIVLGSYSGTLRASRSITVGPKARVDGVLDAPIVEIARGAVVNGGAPEDVKGDTGSQLEPAVDEMTAGSSVDVIPDTLAAPPAEPPEQAPPAPAPPAPEPAADEEIFVASPIFTDGVSRG